MKRLTRKRSVFCKKTRKVRYRDEHEATQALASARIKRQAKESDYAENRAYECSMCQGWHLTSQEPMDISGLPSDEQPDTVPPVTDVPSTGTDWLRRRSR